MNGITVQQAQTAIRLAQRILSVVATEQSRRLACLMDDKKGEPIRGDEIGQKERDAWQAGLNDGLKCGAVDVNDLDFNSLVDAVFGQDKRN
jgi:hypothetical protein